MKFNCDLTTNMQSKSWVYRRLAKISSLVMISPTLYPLQTSPLSSTGTQYGSRVITRTWSKWSNISSDWGELTWEYGELGPVVSRNRVQFYGPFQGFHRQIRSIKLAAYKAQSSTWNVYIYIPPVPAYWVWTVYFPVKARLSPMMTGISSTLMYLENLTSS